MKKILIFVIVFIALLALPFILISNGMLEWYQSMVDNNPNGSMARWAQLRISGTYLGTMRPEKAVDGYAKFMERYPDDPRRQYAMYYHAQSLDGAGRRDLAIEAFEKYLEEYPDAPEKDDVRRILGRLKYVQK